MTSTKLSPAQAALLERGKPHTITYDDGSSRTIGTLVSGHEYRTALSLEKKGLGTLRYQGPSLGWFMTNP